MSLKLVDAIYATLKSDVVFMSLIGLTPSSPPEQVIAKLVRGAEGEATIKASSCPMVRIYVKPGRYGRNHLVFEGKFCLDFYGKSSYQAKQLFERSFELFHDKPVEAPGLRAPRCTLVYDDDFATGITGVKGYESIYDVDYHRIN